jgi:hypothetical protein
MFEEALNQTLLQTDQRALFKLPDNQRGAVIKALEPVMEKLLPKEDSK